MSGILGFETTGRTQVMPDGREFDDGELLLDEDAHKRIRLGYQCGRCMEVFVSAWPDQCRLCGFPVATVQRQYYEREFTGSRAAIAQDARRTVQTLKPVFIKLAGALEKRCQ